jgi:hypothetical protein
MPRHRLPFVLLSVLALACGGPSLELPAERPRGSQLELLPSADSGAAPLLFRARAVNAPIGEPWLIRGEISDYYDRAIARAELPTALRERAVPLRFWREGSDCWLQPLDFLAPDESYTLAFTGVGAVESLHTSSLAQPRARRLFPPAGSAKHRVAVYCDMQGTELPPLWLEPGAVPLKSSASPGNAMMAGCLLLTAERALEQSAVSVPELADSLLDPAPWLPPAVAAPPQDCRGERLHGACVDALDDRIQVTALEADLLWLLDDATEPIVVPRGTRSILARGLTPETEVTLSGSVLSSEGVLSPFVFTTRTSAPRVHLVLNEVLSNPLGAETSGEWIELLNDSSLDASLSGLWLEDSGGRITLPDVTLLPGELALLVAESFAVSVADVPVPAEVRLIPLPSVGTRGLSNSGEVLLLGGSEGVISSFPALAAPHAGRSLARRAPGAADGIAASFAEHGGRGASPGAPNTFETP